jgi:small subunit ribosomal protein S16
MVRIRLRRVGRKGQTSFRLVAADKESPRDGRFIEALGSYNPRTEPAAIQLNDDRLFYWLSVGAQMSDSVERVVKQVGFMERYERFKAGEDVEKLVQEAQALYASRNVDPTTRRPAPVGKPKAVETAEEATEEAAE